MTERFTTLKALNYRKPKPGGKDDPNFNAI